jgi:transcriptional activator HAC1
MLMEELSKLRRSSGVLTRGSSPSLQPTAPLTLSRSLFDSDVKPNMIEDFVLMDAGRTVDPSSLSPELTPVPDEQMSASEIAASVLSANASTSTTSTDVTQHPAAVLCGLQCPSPEVAQSWKASSSLHPALSIFLQLQLLLTASSAMLSACRNPLKLIAGALKHNLALRATPSITSTIIWMVTLPPDYRISTSHNSLTTASAALLQARPRAASQSTKISTPASASSTLRIKSLQKLLTCSPSLARPLKDATLGLLRLVSEGCDDRVERLADGSPNIEGDESRGPLLWPDGASLPSREVLLTLLWAIRVEERKMKAKEAAENLAAPQLASITEPGSSSVLQDKTTNHKIVLLAAAKRKADMADRSSKRLRLGY